MQKIREFEDMARVKVGDGKNPNLYFVSVKGTVLTVTRNLETAYTHFLSLASSMDKEVSLEDRKVGTLATVQPESDKTNAPLEMLNDVSYFHPKLYRAYLAQI